MCSVRSFPRVGHGVGQSHRHRQCGSTFSGSGMVTFCAAGNNERVSKRRHRATGRSAMLPPGGSAGSWYVSRVWGAKCGSGGESGEGVLGNTGVLLLLFRPSDKSHCLYKKRSFLLLRNSGCQITDKYQTVTPCRPHYLRRAVKNILRPALPP